MTVSVTVTRLTPGDLDKYGDAASSTTATHTVEATAIAPADSTEPTERGRQGVIVTHTLYCPAGADVASGDTVTITDENFAGTYDVEGEPAVWVDPWSNAGAGVVVNLRRAAG